MQWRWVRGGEGWGTLTTVARMQVGTVESGSIFLRGEARVERSGCVAPTVTAGIVWLRQAAGHPRGAAYASRHICRG